MAKKSKKPKETAETPFDKFASLARKNVAVPKDRLSHEKQVRPRSQS